MSLGCLNCGLLIIDGQFCSKKCEVEFLTKCRDMGIRGDWLDLEQAERDDLRNALLGKNDPKSELSEPQGGKDGK